MLDGNLAANEVEIFLGFPLKAHWDTFIHKAVYKNTCLRSLFYHPSETLIEQAGPLVLFPFTPLLLWVQTDPVRPSRPHIPQVDCLQTLQLGTAHGNVCF